MAVVQSNGLTFDYEVLGEPTAPPVLLVMGLGMPAALWPDEFVHGLVAQGLRVISFDNRDSGGSTRLEGVRIPSVPMAIARALLRLRVRAPYTLDDMAADTAGLLDAIGVERCHVVGVSMGGMIAQVLTARSPAKVASLTSIMSSTGNPARRIAFGTRHALRAILKPPPASDDIDAVVDHLVEVFGVIGSPGFRQEIPELRRYFERAARRGLYREGSSRQLLAILASGDRRTLLRGISAPTLVIHGAADPLVPVAAGRDTAENIPGSRLEIVEGMGHDFPPILMAQLAVRVADHCWAAQGGRPPAPVVVPVAAPLDAPSATPVAAPGPEPGAESSPTPPAVPEPAPAPTVVADTSARDTPAGRGGSV
jgi:pimeloyl-ACP methyl ester carboxylesterase